MDIVLERLWAPCIPAILGLGAALALEPSPAAQRDPLGRVVEAVANEHANDLKGCYLQTLADGGRVQRDLVVTYMIHSDGHPIVTGLDKHPGGPLAECLLMQIEAWQVDPAYDGDTGRFELHFE